MFLLKIVKQKRKKGEVHVSISKPAIDYSKISYSELEKMADNSDPKAQYELGSGYFLWRI